MNRYQPALAQVALFGVRRFPQSSSLISQKFVAACRPLATRRESTKAKKNKEKKKNKETKKDDGNKEIQSQFVQLPPMPPANGYQLWQQSLQAASETRDWNALKNEAKLEWDEACRENARQVAESVLKLYRRRLPFQLVLEPRMTAYRDFYQKHAQKVLEKQGGERVDVGQLSQIISKQFHQLSAEEKEKYGREPVVAWVDPKELRNKMVLLPPKKRSPSAFNLYVSEKTKGGNMSLAEVSSQYQTLSEAERKTLDHDLKERRKELDLEYENYLRKRTPEDVFLAYLYQLQKIAGETYIKRGRIAGRPPVTPGPFSNYVAAEMRKVKATGQSVKMSELIKDVAKQWRELSQEERESWRQR